MNTPLRAAYLNALLAQASYVEGLRPQDTGGPLEDRLVEELTRPQARLFGDLFRVVTQFTDPLSGFSVTVFADSSDAQYISFRGTAATDLNDVVTDLDALLGSGLARRQVIAMVNWFLRASTATSDEVVQMLEAPVVDQLTGEVLARTVVVQGEGTLPVGVSYTVNGHSLGGHLTTVFSRFFSSHVLTSHTYNGLGVGQTFPETFIAEVDIAVGLGATSWSVVDASQKNYYAQYGIDIAANDWWLRQRGERIALFNELGTGTANHSMYKLTDALALCDVLGALDVGLSLTDVVAILNAASANAPASLESVLDALRRLYRTPNQTPTRIADAAGNDEGRADFHAKLEELRTTIAVSAETSVVSLVGRSTTELLTRAQAANGLAYRYALRELNPFAILGPDTLYAPHNAGGELQVFVDATSTPAGMTAQYLADRAQMLAFLNTANSNDTNAFASNQVSDQVLYTDLVKRSTAESTEELSIELNVFLAGGTANPRGSNTRVIGFGTDGPDAMEGRDNRDRLYGGMGADLLQGGKGDDYLEGGEGMDVYAYRAETSVLRPNWNDGDDEIRDTDGQGVILYTFTGSGAAGTAGRIVGGEALELDDTHWQSADGKFNYERQGTDLRVSINGDAGGSFLIREFDFASAEKEGSFGIRLHDATVTPTSTREFEGDRRILGSYFSIDPDTGVGEWRETYPIPYDEFGNAIRDPNLLLEDAADLFRGSPYNDTLYGRGGQDRLFGEGGDDLLLGGGGNDYIEGGEGDDVIAGSDSALPTSPYYEDLHGGGGDDLIFAGAIQALDEAFRAVASIPEPDVLAAARINGDAGNDMLVGTVFYNYISGGTGDDLVIGGPGGNALTGDDGDDVLYAGAGGAGMSGGMGNDILIAGDRSEIGSGLAGGPSGYAPGDGDDVLIGSIGNDVFSGGDGSDLVYAGGGDDSFSDAYWAYFAPDTIYMGDGNDVVYASHGDDFIDGGAGDDGVNGNGGDDVIYGGPGNDRLYGGWDQIAGAGSEIAGTPMFVDIRSGDDTLYGEEGDDALDGDRGNDALVGGVGNDFLRAGIGNDLLDGGPGNDHLEGGPGGDTYVINADEGIDTIFDAEAGMPGDDKIIFGDGIAPEHLVLLRSSSDIKLFISFSGSDARIEIPWWYEDDERGREERKIESFVFADGLIWDSAEIEDHVVVATGPTGARDRLSGTSGDDLIHALEGADDVTDSAGNDILFGDEHGDRITDSGGHNLLVGGGSNDFLRLNGIPILDEEGEEIGLAGGAPGSFAIGGSGGDSVLIGDYSVVAYNAGDSEDTIRWNEGDIELLTISLGGGISIEDISLSRDDFRLMVNFGPEIPPNEDGDPVPQEAIGLPNLVAAPELWPSLVLQIIGDDVRVYDLGGVVEAYYAEIGQDPEMTRWSAGGALQENLLAISTTQAMGGAIAHQYGTTGSVEGLTPAQIRNVLVGTDFGLAPQPIAPTTANSTPLVSNSIVDQSAIEDVAFAFAVPADTFSDPDTGDGLTYGAALADGSGLPAWLSYDAQTRTFSGTPQQADVGVLDVKVTAIDAGGLSAADTFALMIANVNDVPVVAHQLADLSFEAGAQFSFAVPAGAFADEDPGDALALSVSRFGGGALPSWLTFDPATAVFTGAPAATDFGISHILVSAVDGSGAAAQSDFGLVLRVPAGTEATGGAGDDVIYGGSGDETLAAKGGSDYLYGDAGKDLLKGGGGNDVLQGGAGNDVLRGGKGQNVLDGGMGNDLIFGGAGSAFIVGGAGNDTLRVGSGRDVIAFNAGDGMDMVYGGRDGGNTLSFGGGIRYSDLTLSKSGKDLVVWTGAGEGVALKNWYAGNHSVLNLQIVLDATEDFDAGSGDPLYNRRVQTFDFLGMVSAYDAARATTPGLTSWQITNSLLAFHLSGADDMALGGDLAYWYGKNRMLQGVSLQSAQQVIGAATFGSEAQTLRPFNGLQEGFIKLA